MLSLLFFNECRHRTEQVYCSELMTPTLSGSCSTVAAFVGDLTGATSTVDLLSAIVSVVESLGDMLSSFVVSGVDT